MIGKAKAKIKELFHNGFFHVLFGGTLTKVIAFLSSIIIVRFVDKNSYAYLNYADNIYSYVFLITGFGLDNAVLKFCVSDDREKNNAYLRFAFKYGLSFEILVVAVAAVCMQVLPIAFEESRPYFYALILYPFLYYSVSLMQNFTRARLKNKEYAYGALIQAAILCVVSIAAVKTIQAYSVVVGRYIGAVATIAYLAYVLRSEFDRKEVGRVTLNSEEKSSFVKFGLALLVASVFSLCIPINENFLVSTILKNEVLTANYKVANLIPQQLNFVTWAISTYYFPYFARLTSKEEIWRKSKQVGLLTIGMITACVVVGILITPLLIHILYGDKYADAVSMMSLFWAMYGFNAGIRMLPLNILPAIGYTKFNMILSIVTCAVHFGVDYFCISKWGIHGVAAAGIFVYALSGCCYWIYLWKKVKLEDVMPEETSQR